MGVGAADDGAEAGASGAGVPSSAAARISSDGLSYTPLFQAQHEPRYRRQQLIRDYQNVYDCNLVVFIDQILAESVTYFAELLHGLDPSKDLHLMLCSPGGDGETAIRLARMAQAASARLVVLVPESAKSAATILALGAHELLMGPTSDLGPIDPQVLLADRGFVSAKDVIAAVDNAIEDVAQRPDTYPLHAAMLGGIDAPSVQFARSALNRTADLAKQAISSNPDRSGSEIAELCAAINEPLITSPHSHGALIGASEAKQAKLPVTELDPRCEQWMRIWTLWTQYFALGPIHKLRAYEGERASQLNDPNR
jgi:hypothetical protein